MPTAMVIGNRPRAESVENENEDEDGNGQSLTHTPNGSKQHASQQAQG